jgi:diguanylate cyclase (GGDEF)-like protein
VEYRLRGLDGCERWISDRRFVHHLGGRILIDGIVSDVTGRRRLQDELTSALSEAQEANAALTLAHAQADHNARTDPLTGLWNRRHALTLLDRLVRQHDGGAGCVGLIVVDVDHFKLINDTYGHRAGDHVLTTISRRMQRLLAAEHSVARCGGEEFWVINQGRTARELLADADALRRRLASDPVAVATASLAVSVSAGVASSLQGYSTVDALVDAADSALYRAKQSGRATVKLAA